MTSTAIFLKIPAGLCLETDDDVRAQIHDGDYAFIEFTRARDSAVVLVPVDNIADVIIGGSRER